MSNQAHQNSEATTAGTMPAQGQALSIVCEDGVEIQACLFQPAGNTKGNLLIAPALGVPQRFYRHLAAWLAMQDYRVITFDYRGCGESQVDSALLGEIDFLSWGQQDLHAAISAMFNHGSGQAVHFLGHSMGGQLLGMSTLSSRLASALLVGSSLPHWRRWPWLSGVGLWWLWHALIPLASLGRDRFPSRLLRLGSEDVPAAAMRQWARWCRHPDYLFAERFGVDVSGYAQIRCPILSLHFADDAYASKAACQALLARYPRATPQYRDIQPAEIKARKVGHFGFFRPARAEAGWPVISQWIGSG